MTDKSKSTKRQEMHNRRRRQQLTSTLIWGALGLGVVAILAVVIWQGVRPAVGEKVEIPGDASKHIAEGAPLGPFLSDPPAGGAHYSSELDAKFYEESELASLSKYPEGYLVHNLEHGYVIFWYSCKGLDASVCGALEDQIRGVMDEFGGVKLIAFPWASLDVPVVMTSWGRLQRFETFDPSLAGDFIRANLNRAPEPNAP